MSRFFFLLREAFVNLKRNFLVVAGAVLAVFISLSLAFGALVVNEILRLNTLAWQEGVHVIAFLRDEGSGGVPPGAHQALLQEVQSWEEVRQPDGAFYVDKAQAAAGNSDDQNRIAWYVTSEDAAKTNARVAANPLMVKALRAEGPNRTDLVIHDADAQLIQLLPENFVFLKQAKVMVILDPM